MRDHGTLLLLFASWPFSSAQSGGSSKHGLVYVSTSHSQQDSGQWIRPGSDITWYYNYSPDENPAFSALNFVPMLFSIPSPGDNSFTDQTTTLLTSNKTTHVLSFNEPDGPTSQGGTDLDPSAAAQSFIDVFLPLKKTYPDLSLGLPAVTGSQRGLTWLSNFNTSCYALAPQTGCTADFIPVHWYGDFPGMASYLGQVRAMYLDLPIWVTEFADRDASLTDTQSFLNESVAYLDQLSYVQRYSYFGAFRSEDSNVGGSAAMLDKGGGLTELGVWYLGVNATGKSPDSAASRLFSEGSYDWVWRIPAMFLFAWIL